MPPESPRLAVVCNDVRSEIRAAHAAQRLQCALLCDVDPKRLQDLDFVLLYDEQGLSIQETGAKAPGPVRAEFITGAVGHRYRFGGGKGQQIAKAVGVKAGVYPHVLDLTAGLGRDGFVLASLGCRVTLVERSLPVWLLLEDGLQRARQMAEESELQRVLERIELIAMDGLQYLNGLVEPPDVVYLDPMFPERHKSAEVKKEMRAFHQLVGRDDDADDLLLSALGQARYRVVVKRPRKAPLLAQREPSYQLSGKTTRFDVYALRKLPEQWPEPAASKTACTTE